MVRREKEIRNGSYPKGAGNNIPDSRILANGLTPALWLPRTGSGRERTIRRVNGADSGCVERSSAGFGSSKEVEQVVENQVQAPHDGTVGKLYVKNGDSVAEGDLLVHLERSFISSL